MFECGRKRRCIFFIIFFSFFSQQSPKTGQVGVLIFQLKYRYDNLTCFQKRFRQLIILGIFHLFIFKTRFITIFFFLFKETRKLDILEKKKKIHFYFELCNFCLFCATVRHDFQSQIRTLAPYSPVCAFSSDSPVRFESPIRKIQTFNTFGLLSHPCDFSRGRKYKIIGNFLMCKRG